ncbi:MAG: hypothetical protein ACOC5A_03020 [Halanaerobiales bacterium]
MTETLIRELGISGERRIVERLNFDELGVFKNRKRESVQGGFKWYYIFLH